MGVLNPQFLINNIEIISIITAGAILIIFSDFVTKRIMLTFADKVKGKTHEKIKNYGKERKNKAFEKYISKYISEILATTIFLLYVFLGTKVLAEYVIGPILLRLQHIILIITLVIFFLISYTINTKRVRKKFMKF